MSKVISFTGGMGAQLFSAAAYFYLEQQGVPVAADMRYFSRAESIATPGNKGQVSHWGWDLDRFGLPLSAFRTATQGELIPDSAEKIRLAMLGFNQAEVVARFPIHPAAQAQAQQMFGGQPFACLHVRRGDYLNVATYVVSDDALFRAIAKVSRLVKHLLIVSDSPLSEQMVGLINTLPLNAVVAVGGEAALVHGLMRLADVLVCSNSQFSFSAAVMRDRFSLTLYPARHEADENSYTNAFLGSIREFQVLTSF
ncbi:MAG TPA: hypothetical protein VGE47_00835 [Burkholderiaceae bacterium]